MMRPALEPSRHALVAVALAAVLAVPSLAEMTRERHEVYDLSASGRVTLDNINGDVLIEAWDRDEVSVDAVIRGRSQRDLDDVRIDITASADSVRIETDYDSDRRHGDNHATVDYTLKVPRGAHLSQVELVNGSLTITGVEGRVEASLVNGDLIARGLAGDVELESVNGQVEATFHTLRGDARVEISSVNGSVEVELPRDADVEINAETVHGRIRNDFGLTVDKGEWVGSSLRGRLLGGTARIRLETVNGGIEIRQSS